MEPSQMDPKQEKKPPKFIKKDKADEMHKLYKDKKALKVSTWVRYDAAELVQVIDAFKAQKVRFFLGADPERKNNKGNYLPIIVMQLERGLGLKPEYFHYIPEGDEDRCPLPEGCDNYDDI